MQRFLLAVSFTILATLAGCAAGLRHDIETAVVDGTYEPPVESTQACSDGVKLLESKAGVPVLRIQGLEGFGATDYETIFLTAGMSSCAELETLAHEVGHLREPKGLTERERQMFADLVSYEVVKILGGYDPRDRYVKYLSQFKLDARMIDLYSREIAAVVKDLTSK